MLRARALLSKIANLRFECETLAEKDLMQSRCNKHVTVSRVFAVGLGFFVVAGASLATFDSPVIRYAPAPVFAAVDPGCKVVLDANRKTILTPYHSYSTMGGGVSGGAPMNIEMIYVQGATYTGVDGKWTVSPVTEQDIKDMLATKESMNSQSVCKHLRDEPVSGENAVVYSSHSGSERSTIDSTFWISTSKGLVLRMEADITDKSGSKSQMSVRYEYKNVQKPAL
jgi:hypothetical protein